MPASPVACNFLSLFFDSASFQIKKTTNDTVRQCSKKTRKNPRAVSSVLLPAHGRARRDV